jgi:hypothetical protein
MVPGDELGLKCCMSGESTPASGSIARSAPAKRQRHGDADDTAIERKQTISD